MEGFNYRGVNLSALKRETIEIRANALKITSSAGTAEDVKKLAEEVVKLTTILNEVLQRGEQFLTPAPVKTKTEDIEDIRKKIKEIKQEAILDELKWRKSFK